MALVPDRKKLIGDLLDIVKTHPLEVQVKVSAKELVALKLTDKKVDIDLRDPEQLARLLRILKDVE
jgi:hypothetical protein